MFVGSFQESCRMRCICMSTLPRSVARDVCECSRNSTKRDAHSSYPTVRDAYAYTRTEDAWSVSTRSMNPAVQGVHACSKHETARDTCVSSRNETDGWTPDMEPPKISACVPGMKPCDIPPGFQPGEVPVGFPVNKLKKNYNYATLLQVWPTQYSYRTPSSISTYRRYLQFSPIQPNVGRGCHTIVNSLATSNHAPVTRITLKVNITFTSQWYGLLIMQWKNRSTRWDILQENA